MPPSLPGQHGIRRHIIDGAARVFLAEALFPITAIITAAFLTRRLGKDGYGLLALTGAVSAWIAVRTLWSVSPPATTMLRCALLSPVAYLLPVVWPVRGPWILLQLILLGGLMVAILVVIGELRGIFQKLFFIRRTNDAEEGT